MRKVGIALATTLAAWNMSGCSARKQEPLDTLTRQERAHAEKVFADTKAYWVRRGIGVSTVKLAIPQGKQKVECDYGNLAPKEDVGYSDRAVYCNGNDTVVLPALTVKEARVYSPNGLSSDFTIADLLGYSIQDAIGTLDPLFGSDIEQERLAKQAVCFAGASMQATHDRKEVVKIADYLRNRPAVEDSPYGSPNEQADLFKRGTEETNFNLEEMCKL